MVWYSFVAMVTKHFVKTSAILRNGTALEGYQGRNSHPAHFQTERLTWKQDSILPLAVAHFQTVIFIPRPDGYHLHFQYTHILFTWTLFLFLLVFRMERLLCSWPHAGITWTLCSTCVRAGVMSTCRTVYV